MDLQHDEYSINKYYTYNFRFLKLIGIWRYDVSPKQLIYICALNFMITVGSLSQIYLLLASELKVVPIIKLMETTLPSLCFAMCYYNILVNTTTVRNSNISFCIISDKNVCYRSLNVANETKLVLPVCLDNILKNQKNYYWAFFFECAFIFIIGTIGIAHYSMFVLIVQHACALFNIVASRIEDGFKSNPLNLNDANHSIFAQEYEWLVDIIKLYDNAVERAESGGTAIPAQPPAEAEQAPAFRQVSKI
ncbi:hypothetical protein HZH68_017119 [Vespula germanica]|uniref:Uncharacterized protein n=1 Tax=Vespula germanica TaxID=30212 RepID=A0A834J2B0_VESGE|nr:hypothetical protein HZH68_017119 [Vespula germanica]